LFRGSYQSPQTRQGGQGDIDDRKVRMRNAVAYRASVMDPPVPQSLFSPGLDEFLLLRMPAHGILDALLFVHQELGFEVFYVIFFCV
jgi:hypothetical protein